MGYSGGIGYRFLPQLRGDVTFTYRPSIKFSVIDSVPEVGIGKLTNYSIMANAYYDINLNIPFIPYIMGGVGVSSNKTHRVFFPVVVQHEYGTFTQSATWQVGAGVSYPILKQLLVDLNYQYINLRKFNNTGHFDVDPVPPFVAGLIGTPTSFQNLYSNQIQLGLRYYF